MKRLFWLLVLAIVVLAIVAATFPAKLAVRLLPSSRLPVQLEEVAGTVWSGRAERVLRNGADLGRLQWTVHPAGLLRGQIDADLALQGQALDGTGRVVAARDGSVRIAGAKVRFPAARMDRLLDVPALTLVGNVDLVIEDLELRGRVPVALTGQATWRDAGVSGGEQATFGTLQARFGALDGGGFGGTLGDQGDGPLALDGSFRTTLMGFEARATLRARDDDPQVQRALRHIGQMQPDGSVVYEVKGGLAGKGS